MSNSTFRILVSSDNHVGYAEDKPIIGNDSFDAFEEVLEHADDQKVDFVLLGGDLFHKSEPDRSTAHKVTELLRNYVLGSRNLSFELISEPGDTFGFSKFGRVNFEDPNINIGIPIFTIHGNHDDFSGKGLLALDNFHDSGYLNLFGKFTDVEKIEVKPILLRKGATKIALYGIGHQRDDRLCRAFNLGKVKFYTLPEGFEEYFKILVVHQNRPQRSMTRSTGSYLPVEKIPKFFDLVIWGHEHACEIEDFLYERTGEPFVLQPGSSVATSLCPDETRPKAIAILEIKGASMEIKKIPLQRSRQILYEVLDLNKVDPYAKLPKTTIRTKTEMKDEEMIHKKIKSMIKEAKKTRGDNQPDLPRLRLKVIYSGNWLNLPRLKPSLISEKYKELVANPSDMIMIQYKNTEKEKVSETEIDLPNMTDTTTVFDLLRESIKQRAQNGLGLLPLDQMENLVKEQSSGAKLKANKKDNPLRRLIDDQIENYKTRIQRLDTNKLGELPTPKEIKELAAFGVEKLIENNQNVDVSNVSGTSNDENMTSDDITQGSKRVPPASVVPDSQEFFDLNDEDEFPMGQPNDNEVCAAGDGRPPKMPRTDEDNQVIELSKFQFKEVLGGDPSRKSIFILIEHQENKNEAILIMDKLAFAEDMNVINSWLPGTKLEFKAINDIYHNYIAYLGDQFSGVKTTIVYPCTQKHIVKYRRKEPYIAYETPEDYKNITLPYIREKAVSLQWVYNVLEGKSELDRIIHHDKDPITGFLLAMDLKWSGTEVDSLYLQAIVNRRDIPSVRALTAEHLPLLKNIKDSVYSIVEEKYGLKKSQIKMYFHYQPSYFHLHVHVINLKYEAPASGMTSIPLEEVINNIEIWPDFYEKATLMFVNGRHDPIMEKFIAAGRVNV